MSNTNHSLLPPDDLTRSLTISNPEGDQKLLHLGVVGDTYTITVSGPDTAGRFCVIDMHVPAGAAAHHLTGTTSKRHSLCSTAKSKLRSEARSKP